MANARQNNNIRPDRHRGLELYTLSWPSPSSLAGRPDGRVAISALIDNDTNSPCPLRIVFLPYICDSETEWEEIRTVKDHYNIPGEVDDEQGQSVTHSFGSSSVNAANVELTWFHFLSRYLSRHDKGHAKEDYSRQATWGWNIGQYVLHVQRRGSNPPCGGTAGHQRTTTVPRTFVTLLCFGASDRVSNRLQSLLDDRYWRRYAEEPLALFQVVWDGLYELVDKTAWVAGDLFAQAEWSTLDLAKAQRTGISRDSANQMVDLAGLHNTSKDCIYLLEGVAAAIMTLDAIIAHVSAQTALATTALPTADMSTSTVIKLARAFEYRKRTFQSTQLRLQSLEKRITNINSLSFNLMTQQDSQIMRADSRAMKIIAVLTMVFLPATGVASVLSSPFFRVEFESEPQALEVARSFRWFWIVVVPLTFAVLVLWWLWYWTRLWERLTRGVSSRFSRPQTPQHPAAREMT